MFLFPSFLSFFFFKSLRIIPRDANIFLEIKCTFSSALFSAQFFIQEYKTRSCWFRRARCTSADRDLYLARMCVCVCVCMQRTSNVHERNENKLGRDRWKALLGYFDCAKAPVRVKEPSLVTLCNVLRFSALLNRSCVTSELTRREAFLPRQVVRAI